MIATSAVVLVGLALVCAAEYGSVAMVRAELADGRIVNLNTIADIHSLAPIFTFWADSSDRELAAKRVLAFVRDSHGVPNVGALARIRVALADLASGGNQSRARASAAFDAGRHNPIPLLTASQLSQIKPRLAVRTPSRFLLDAVPWSLACLAVFWCVHAVWRRQGFKGDQLILPVLHALTGIGLIVMIALRDPVRDIESFSNFSLGVCVGALLLLALSFVDFERRLGAFSFIPLLLSFALSVLLLVFGRGPAGSDAKVNLGPIQPVEVIKLLLVLFLAGYFGRHWEFLRLLRGAGPLARRFPSWTALPRLDYVLPVLASSALALMFFFFQRDLGPALIFGTVFLALYSVARNRFGLALLGAAILVGGIAVGYRAGVPSTVSGRIEMWLSPWANAVRGGDQLAHSLWAFSGGGIFGAGLGMANASFIPAGHTDLILTTIGEELGWIGVVFVFALYGILLWRGCRIARNCVQPYSFFLAFGVVTVLAAETLLISCGVLGLAPLSGVVLPFLSYGRTSMLANLAAFGVLLSVSRTENVRPAHSPFEAPVRKVAAAIALVAVIVVARAGWVQGYRSQEIVAMPALVLQGDGIFRYEYNPRLVKLARLLPRGSIYDRNGIPLATSRREEIESHQSAYAAIGVSPESCCSSADSRFYPLGSATFHLLGDRRRRIGWAAPNTAFVERDAALDLQGYSDRGRVEMAPDPRGGSPLRVVRFDYGPLVPLLYRPDVPALAGGEGVRLTIDARLQARVAASLHRRAAEAGSERGAAIVLDAATGDLLALVSQPAPDLARSGPVNDEQVLDRARFGLYPPGSTFKMIVSLAALRVGAGLADQRFKCTRLDDGRVGAVVRREVIHDDVSDRTPHGSLDLERALSLSCNAYFAQLGASLGARSLFEAASLFGIRAASPNNVERLAAFLPRASFGQGEVLVTPLQMARVAAAIANGGVAMPINDRLGAPPTRGKTVLDPTNSALLARFLRAVVTSGTAAAQLKSNPTQIAGKTGTAEVNDARAHSWFAGFAPYNEGSRRRIAFAVILENGGYGGGAAAATAGDIVEAARSLGMLD